MNLGWIKLHRSLLDHWAASEPEMLATWIRLLLEANHEDKKHLFNGSLIEVKRGELIFGLNAFSDKTGISIKKLRRYLDLFEKDGMIGRQKTNKFSIISITCYDSYQNEGSQKASKGQAKGKQRATPKEDKEDKEDKKSKLELAFDFAKSHLPDADDKDLKDWLEFRKSKGKLELSDRVFSLIKSESLKAGVTPEQAIKLAADNQWLSFQAKYLGGSDSLFRQATHAQPPRRSFR